MCTCKVRVNRSKVEYSINIVVINILQIKLDTLPQLCRNVCFFLTFVLFSVCVCVAAENGLEVAGVTAHGFLVFLRFMFIAPCGSVTNVFPYIFHTPGLRMSHCSFFLEKDKRSPTLR